MEYNDGFKLLNEDEMQKIAKEYGRHLDERKNKNKQKIEEGESLTLIQKKENIQELAKLINKSTRILKIIRQKIKKPTVKSLIKELIVININNTKEIKVISEYISSEIFSAKIHNNKLYVYLKKVIDLEIDILKRIINIIHFEENEIIKTSLHKLLQDRFYVLKKLNNIYFM